MFDGAKLVVGGVVGALLGFTVTFGWVSWFTIPAARDAATVAEQARTQAQVDAAIANAEYERAKKQAEINAAEAAYVRLEATRAAQMTGLEIAIQAEKDRDVPIPQGAPRACPPALPRGLSIALDNVGRAAAAGQPSGLPAGPVR